MDEEFRRNVQAIVREQLRDQKMVEIETADAVLLRLKTWAKPFLYSLAVLAAVLGLLGFRTLKDAMEGLREAQQQALLALRQQAANESKSLSDEAATIRAQYRKVGDQQDLVDKLKQAESQLTAIQVAGKKLKEKYELASTELAQRQDSGEPSRVSNRIGMTLGSGGGSGSEPRFVAPGSSGTAVQRIQERLTELGCYRGPVSGAYDGATKSAVERFNQARGELLASGVVDPPTWEALFAKAAAPRCR